uniref:F-box domain-containing protein n=1 Tax=Panagrellus redivivus TaxID=6233 RepID=A0A7E4V0E4_PANRE
MSTFVRSNRATAQNLLQKLLLEFGHLKREYREAESNDDVAKLLPKLADIKERLASAQCEVEDFSILMRQEKESCRVYSRFKKSHVKKRKFKPKATRLIQSSISAIDKLDYMMQNLHNTSTLRLSKLPYGILCRLVDLAPPEEALRFQNLCKFTEKAMSRRARFTEWLCINCQAVPQYRNPRSLHLSVSEVLTKRYFVTERLVITFNETFQSAPFIRGCYSWVQFLGSYSCSQIYPFLHSKLKTIRIMGNVNIEAGNYNTLIETLHSKTNVMEMR